MATRKKAEKEKEPAREQVAEKAVKSSAPHAEATPPRKKIGKLVKKAKQRLPRKEKKQAKKRLLMSAG